MRCYYINLARRTDRRAIMEQRFADLGLEHDRVEALTPDAITSEQRERYCNPAEHAWQSEGELACSLSHLQAMHQFLSTPAPYAAIFEDDAVLAPSLPALLEQFEQAAPQVDILRLETTNTRMRLLPRGDAQIGEFAIHRMLSTGGAAAGYVMSRKGAARVLAGEEVLFDLTDQALFNPYAPIARDLTVRQLVPALVVQEDRLGQRADRIANSDLESTRRHRDLIDKANFWRRAHYNFVDFVARDIALPLRNVWLRLTLGAAKRDVPFKAE